MFDESVLRYANQFCWRGICTVHLSHKYNHELNAWGRGKRFGFVKIDDNKVYWYALANAENQQRDASQLVEMFKEFHQDILTIISATNLQQIIFSPIIDLKPLYKWQTNNICLVGDAAHVTTPNLGQGDCQAIEDAYVIGKLLGKGNSFAQTFVEYESIRRKKAHHIVHTSWNVGKLAHIENTFGICLRNTIMRSMPTSLNNKQLKFIFNLEL